MSFAEEKTTVGTCRDSGRALTDEDLLAADRTHASRRTGDATLERLVAPSGVAEQAAARAQEAQMLGLLADLPIGNER